MKRIILTALAVAAFAFAAEAQEFGQTIPSVTVSGTSQIKITPDLIYMSITLDESDTKGKISLDEQRKKMFAALKKCGIDAEKQLTVVDMSSSFFRKGGSLSSSQYELKVSSPAEARKVFETLNAYGIPNVDVTRTASSKIDFYRDQARIEAMQNAQKRAKDLAEAVGQSIGMCYEITDYSNNVQPIMFRTAAMTKNAVQMDAAEASYDPDVEFEQIVLNYNLTAKFVLNSK